MLGIRNIDWVGDAAAGHLRLLDQTRLPTITAYLDCKTVQDVWDAIKQLSVRGAPAIGIAAAFGCVIAKRDEEAGEEGAFERGCEYLKTSRPTAVNLFWAIDRMRRVVPPTAETLLRVAKQIHEQDAAMCRAIGEHGLKLIDRLPVHARGVLTHCNAGALATGGVGTATAPMYLAREKGLDFNVFADETRPLLQGSRLTAFELAAAGIDTTLICDDMAGQVMREGRVGMVITGADRIARNGDTANKIGTYTLAVLAKHHEVPFYVAAPSSTFDFELESGSEIPIEERGGEEITHGFGRSTAPENAKTYSPAFDVTPAELITAIVTEKGIIEPVDEHTIRSVLL
ncbi:MAG: S-methyl-5-thioribose-1-phosphate isomerase [Phycisphaeraceae bacterium]